MSFDGITTRMVVNELQNIVINSRVEKIFVPSKNEVWLSLHTASRENVKLLISVDANNCRFHLSSASRNNPEKAPQFCMILRKYLVGAKLVNIEQIGLDRIIKFSFENFNDFGDIVQRNLVVELMGKYSNIILLDNFKILDAIRHVDITMSSVREVLPSKKYIFPNSLGKYNFEEISFDEFSDILRNNIASSEFEEISVANIISNNFIGFSRTIASTICRACSIPNTILKNNIDDALIKYLHEKISQVLDMANNSRLSFELTENKKDYTINLNFNELNNKTSSFLDNFYTQKENISLVKNAKQNLEREVNMHINKLNKKLSLMLETLNEKSNLEKYRQFGEIINANIYRMQIGMDKLVTENFYDNNNTIEIPLQTNLTPARNASLYFKKYNKLKNSILHAEENKHIYEDEINYLTSVLFEIEYSDSLFELDEIHEELANNGYIKKNNKKGKKTEEPSKPLEFKYNDIKILVGKNNVQNDKLTLKLAKKNYTWLHTKNVPGSHVIIESENIDNSTLLYAATLAKEHSSAKNSSKVEVDYCLVKHVHKESGAKPGMVVYTNYKTIIVD